MDPSLLMLSLLHAWGGLGTQPHVWGDSSRASISLSCHPRQPPTATAHHPPASSSLQKKRTSSKTATISCFLSPFLHRGCCRPFPHTPRILCRFCNAITGAGEGLDEAQLSDHDFAKMGLKNVSRQAGGKICSLPKHQRVITPSQRSRWDAARPGRGRTKGHRVSKNGTSGSVPLLEDFSSRPE